MTTIHRRAILAVFALAFAGLSALTPSPVFSQVRASGPGEKPTVVVNITRSKEDLHAVSMAIGLASDAITAGRRSIIFLNVHAPVFAAADLPTDVKFADFPPVKEMLASFVAAGGELYVCGHCASILKITESKLMKGAVMTMHGDLYRKLPATALTFSY